jgi:hypothetical protein
VTRTVHQLKITLREVKPPVWRRIVVRSETWLSDLAPILEAAMGWESYHLHAFDVDGVRYGVPDPDWPMLEFIDDSEARLGEVLATVGAKMLYEYDFGDGWEHDVLVESISLPQRGVTYPVCIAGRRACPPEDCGGPWGYADLLDVLRNPNHPEHVAMREWAGPDFDPSRFSVDGTTERMQSPPGDDW